jgi:hypothetical protein
MHAVSKIDQDVELKQYRLYDGEVLYMEDAYAPRRSPTRGSSDVLKLGPVRETQLLPHYDLYTWTGIPP